jgi:hypothetical protein
VTFDPPTGGLAGCAGLRGCGLLGSVGHRSAGPVHSLAYKCAWCRAPPHTNPLPSTITFLAELQLVFL